MRGVHQVPSFIAQNLSHLQNTKYIAYSKSLPINILYYIELYIKPWKTIIGISTAEKSR